jgi:hypothetical protein
VRGFFVGWRRQGCEQASGIGAAGAARAGAAESRGLLLGEIYIGGIVSTMLNLELRQRHINVESDVCSYLKLYKRAYYVVTERVKREERSVPREGGYRANLQITT